MSSTRASLSPSSPQCIGCILKVQRLDKKNMLLKKQVLKLGSKVTAANWRITQLEQRVANHELKNGCLEKTDTSRNEIAYGDENQIAYDHWLFEHGMYPEGHWLEVVAEDLLFPEEENNCSRSNEFACK